MNAIGWMLAGSIAHETLFAIAAMAAYLAIRRQGPAAGSLAAGTSLAIMGIVSIVVLSPWPSWWRFGAVDRPAASAAVTDVAEEASAPTGGGETARESSSRPRPGRPAKGIGTLSTAAPSLLELFIDELRSPSTSWAAEGWDWRGWLVAGFLAGLILGAARLALGLRGIARLRASSRPLEDHELEELVAELRAELGCVRRVELREATELATPATIGWRRPVVLLPADWRNWDREERRAVLAHELAHVRRGDFAAGLAAQLVVAMHFYHPLAHWLANRLRLEQEMAADAWGAQLSGGKASYLATLARMALRRDGPAPTWPARAFLPSHGTFARRIEMLKNHGPIPHITVSPARRVLTVAALACVGLAVSGLRGPVGDSPVLAQERPSEPSAREPHSLSYLPAEARMVLSLRPGALLRRPDAGKLLEILRQGPWFARGFPVPPEEIEQLLVFWESGGQPDAPAWGGQVLLPPPSGIVLRMSKAQDWRAVLTRLAGPAIAEGRHDGQTYFRLHPNAQSPLGLYTPDDRTAVVAEEVLLRDVITDRHAPAPPYPWDEAWKRVDKGQLMIAVDMRWFRRQVVRAEDRTSRGSLTLETFAPLYEKARSYAVSLDASDRSMTLDLVAAAGSPENARPVAETLQAVLTLGKNAVGGLRRDPPPSGGSGREAAEWLLGAADSVLEKARIETTGSLVRVHAESPVDLAEGIRRLTPTLANVQAARRRVQSVNNLKQIGLAFHNFHNANNRFPAAINKDKGPFPYSWRVAILPYIEQQDLYNQYRFDEPWDGPNNRKLIDRMPALYAYPAFDGTPSSRSSPSYFVFTGDSTIGGVEGGSQLSQITDGTSNTILAVEARRDIPWTRPEDLPFDPKAPLAGLGGFTPDGFNALFCDGAVRHLKKSINTMVLKALITRDGGEVISTDTF